MSSQKEKQPSLPFKMGVLKTSSGEPVVVMETDGHVLTCSLGEWQKKERKHHRLLDVQSHGMKVQYSRTYHDDSYQEWKHDIYVTRITSDTIFVESERALGRRGTIDQYDRKTGMLRVKDGFHSRIGTPRILQESLKEIEKLAKGAKEIVFC